MFIELYNEQYYIYNKYYINRFIYIYVDSVTIDSYNKYNNIWKKILLTRPLHNKTYETLPCLYVTLDTNNLGVTKWFEFEIMEL